MSRISILNEVIEASRGRAFEWGTWDCCQFVGAVDAAINGDDRRTRFAAYDSEFGAARMLVEHGGMESLLREAFGEPKPAAFAQRGDVVLADFGRGPQPSICIGAHCVAPSEAGGLANRRIIGDKNYPDAIMAWSI